MDFKIGDWVYAGDWCYGEIVSIDEDNDIIFVEFDTGTGGGTWSFERDEVRFAEERKSKKKIYFLTTSNKFDFYVLPAIRISMEEGSHTFLLLSWLKWTVGIAW